MRCSATSICDSILCFNLHWRHFIFLCRNISFGNLVCLCLKPHFSSLILLFSLLGLPSFCFLFFLPRLWLCPGVDNLSWAGAWVGTTQPPGRWSNLIYLIVSLSMGESLFHSPFSILENDDNADDDDGDYCYKPGEDRSKLIMESWWSHRLRCGAGGWWQRLQPNIKSRHMFILHVLLGFV